MFKARLFIPHEWTGRCLFPFHLADIHSQSRFISNETFFSRVFIPNKCMHFNCTFLNIYINALHWICTTYFMQLYLHSKYLAWNGHFCCYTAITQHELKQCNFVCLFLWSFLFVPISREKSDCLCGIWRNKSEEKQGIWAKKSTINEKKAHQTIII